MKKKKLNKKLILRKQTISHLSNLMQNEIKGGYEIKRIDPPSWPCGRTRDFIFYKYTQRCSINYTCTIRCGCPQTIIWGCPKETGVNPC